MKTITSSPSLPHENPASHFAEARALAFSLAQSESDLVEPELVAWIDRSAGLVSPILEGCSGPEGWRYYGISHGGRLEVDVDNDVSFIFADSSSFESYEDLGPGPFRNLRDDEGHELICLSGGRACVPLDEWMSKLT
jgi:hypothetical protein